MKKAWAVLLTLALLAGCGGGGGSDSGNNGGNNGDNGGSNGGNNGGSNTASVDGYAFAAARQLTTAQAPLTDAQVEAFTLPAGATPVATARTNSSGRFSFSTVTSNGLPVGRTVLIRVSGGGRVVSGLLNTLAGTVSKNLNEATHLAALALSSGNGASDADISLMEVAARQELEDALESNPALDVSAVAGQEQARQLAAQAAAKVAAGQVAANLPPVVQNLSLTPAQLGHAGGEARISLQATDPEGAALQVVALVYLPGSPTQVVNLQGNGGQYSGSFSVGANSTLAVRVYTVAVMVDDGAQPSTPAAVRLLSVLPEGRITLDILAETLFDEPASRGRLADQLDRLRPTVRREGARRSRQVNSNQSMRNVHVVVDDQPSTQGDTDSQGFVLFDVPLTLVEDGVLSVTATFAGRVPYRQILVLPAGTDIRSGDTIEIDLAMATREQWQQVATEQGLASTLDYALVPLVGFFNVLTGVNPGVTPAAQTYQPIPQTDRDDDRDFFITNVPAGAAVMSGTFADPENASVSPPFGPVSLELAGGHVHAVAAILPPS